jgi:transposase
MPIASRREAAKEFEVSAGTAIIWVKCFRETGRCASKLRGGSILPSEKHADVLLGLIEKQSDLILDEVVLAMRKHKSWQSRGSLTVEPSKVTPGRAGHHGDKTQRSSA